MIDDYSGTDRWQLRAACKELDTNLFYPERGEQCEDAKAICSGCPVKRECLDYGMDNRELGIWGGLSERERRSLRRGKPRRKPRAPRLPVSAFRSPKDKTAAARGERYRAKKKAQRLGPQDDEMTA